MESVLDVPMNLHLKFHQNRVSNSWDIGNIEFVWWGVGWFAKSFSCLTQLKVMLGWVELWLSWGFDKKFIIVFYKTFHVALDVPWIFTTFMLPWHPTSTDSTCCIWCSLFPMFNLSKVFEISNNDTPIEKWPYYLLM